MAEPKVPKPRIPIARPRVGRIKRFFLDIDARLGHAFFALSVAARARYEGFSVFMDRFHVSGMKRLFVEGASEGVTLGTAGAVLMLALAVPAFRETTDEDWLKKAELAVIFLDRYGNKLGERGIRHNDTVPLEEFPDHLVKAVLATEDRRFYEHFGIDFPGTFRALGANVRAQGVVQGGSSITQQLAKNLFLSNERTIERKVKEAFLAVWLETRLKKNEILKLYLDRAYLGGGAFGVDAAAQYYFGKSAREVTLAESAMLAGLFKAPARFAPHVNLPAARARGNVVLDNLIEAGFMSEGQVFGARRNPAKPARPRRGGDPELLPRLGVPRGAGDRGEEAAAHGHRAGIRGAHRARPQHPEGRRVFAGIDAAPVRQGLWREPGRLRADGDERARCAPWSAAATTTRASSTGRRTRCASPAPRSSRSSMRRRFMNGMKPTTVILDGAALHRQLVPA